MKAEKVTRELLRSMAPGATITIELPSYSKIESARTLISQVRRLDNVDYTAESDTVKNIIKIKRL